MSGSAHPDSGSGFFRALSFSGGNNASVVSNPDGAMETSPSSGSITRNQSGNNLESGNGVSEHKVKSTCFYLYRAVSLNVGYTGSRKQNKMNFICLCHPVVMWDFLPYS